tara:strand:+ start:62 stop:373 length:312 start_codon:yes stop_codon:yes gene_type:complete
MILEVAILNVKNELQENFEKDFKIASQYISSIKGYKGHSLRKCMENENQYILLVDWENIQNHEVDFRQSDAYLKWKELLHDYYEPFPIVEHYETVFENKIYNS